MFKPKQNKPPVLQGPVEDHCCLSIASAETQNVNSLFD